MSELHGRAMLRAMLEELARTYVSISGAPILLLLAVAFASSANQAGEADEKIIAVLENDPI